MNFIYEFHQQSSEQMTFILKNIVFTFIMLYGTQHSSLLLDIPVFCLFLFVNVFPHEWVLQRYTVLTGILVYRSYWHPGIPFILASRYTVHTGILVYRSYWHPGIPFILAFRYTVHTGITVYRKNVPVYRKNVPVYR